MFGTRSRHTLFLVVLGTLLASGCGGGSGHGGGGSEPPPPPPPPPPPTTSTLRYELTDGCADGLGLFVRYFDVDHDLLWPDATNAYVIPSGGVGGHSLSCQKGAKVCFGAESSDRSLYWGVGLDLAYSCANCCAACQGQTVAWTLTCQSARAPGGPPVAGELRPDRDDPGPGRDRLPIDDRMRPEREPWTDRLPVESW